MTYHWIIPLVAALANFSLALMVHRIGPRTALRRVFVLTAISLAFWNLIYVVFYSVTDHDRAFQLARIVRCGAMFLFPAVLHLAVILPGRQRRPLVWWLLAIDYIAFISLAIANAFDLLVSDLRVVRWGYYSVGTPLYDLFTILVLVSFAGVFALLIHEYRTTPEPRMRLQLKFWLFGMAIALPLGLTNLLPAYGIPIYPLGNLGSVVWAGIVAYAIVRHRLMDIEVAVSKGIAYLGVAVVVAGPAFLIALAMQRLAFGELHYDFSAGLLLLLLSTGVLFPLLRSWAEAQVERSLFPQKQEHRATLYAFERSIIRILDRDKLVREFCDTLQAVFELDRIALYLREDVRGGFEVRRASGNVPGTNTFPAEHPFVRWLAQRGDAVLRDEIEFSHGRVEPKGIVELFRTNGWEVCLPLVSGLVLTGFVALGRRQDRKAFTAGDLEVLWRVGAQASIAFENARLYEELRRSRDIINRAGRLSALGTLAAGIAHEIRNPLVSIQTFFQLAPQRLDDVEFMTSFLRLAEGEVHRIGNLISELLTFAKSPAPAVGELQIDELIERAITLLDPQARNQQVTLRRGRNEQVPTVVADPDQIMQVVINIVLNAIQATPNGGIVTIDVREVENESGRFCQIEVRDTGPGIPAEIREEIFNPFFTTKDKGTGLGLPVAHRIIAEYDGFISVDSVEGQGSRFCIHLPAAQLVRGDIRTDDPFERSVG